MLDMSAETEELDAVIVVTDTNESVLVSAEPYSVGTSVLSDEIVEDVVTAAAMTSLPATALGLDTLPSTRSSSAQFLPT